MPRKSSRLQSTGYYDSEGTPSISYKETLFKVFKRRRDRSGSSRRRSINTRTTNDSLFSHTYSNVSFLNDTNSIDSYLSDTDTKDSYVTSRSRNRRKTRNTNSHNVISNSHSDHSDTDTRDATIFYPKIFVFLLFMLPLCFGLVYLRSIFLVSGPIDSSVPPTVLDKDLHLQDLHLQDLHLQDLHAGREDIAKHVRELQDEVLKLKQKMNYLLTDADTWTNFALESLGARVLFQRSSKTYQTKDVGKGGTNDFLGIPIWNLPVSPRTVIQGRAPLMPGCCWAFAGGRGHLSIALSHPVTISHVTLGHIAKSVSPTGAIISAPREFSVYGMETLDGEETKLGTFLYDQDGDSAQTFKIPDHKKGVFSFVKLQVESNWGHPDYSCLYSFKVHGNLAD